MLPYPFDPATGRRRSMEEQVQWVEHTYGMSMVNGFGRMVELQHVMHNPDRVASFGEYHPYEAWHLNQTREGGLIRWVSAPVHDTQAPYYVFMFGIGMGNGSYMPQPTGRFDLYMNGEQITSLWVMKHSETWEENGLRFHYDMKRLEAAEPGQALFLDSLIREEAFASFGLLVVRVPRDRFRCGDQVEFAVRSFNRARSTQWFKLEKGVNIRFHTNYVEAMEALARGRVAPKVGDHNVYFGDIHNHSGQSCEGYGTCGMGTVDENYLYARDVTRLDFYGLTEHDWQTEKAHWELLMQKVDQYNDPGRFATIPCFEWTSLAYGHRNVYYADTNQPFFLAWQEGATGHQRQPLGPQLDNPADLWRKLDELNTFAMTAPHHPSASSHPLNWDFFNPKYDRFVEIYSCWGSSEHPQNELRGFGADRYAHLYIRDALNRGLRFGLVASSDGHDGNPGNAQSPHVKHHHLYHYLGSGRTAVLAPDLSRQSVLEALHDRRCYATTGEPMVLDFRVSGHLMGRELSVGQTGRKPVITADVTGTTHLKRLEIIKNGRVAWRQECYDDCFNHETVSWVDEALDTRQDNYYYFKAIQRDGETAWSSPVWINRE